MITERTSSNYPNTELRPANWTCRAHPHPLVDAGDVKHMAAAREKPAMFLLLVLLVTYAAGGPEAVRRALLGLVFERRRHPRIAHAPFKDSLRPSN